MGYLNEECAISWLIPPFFLHLIRSKPGDHLFCSLAREQRSAISVGLIKDINEPR